MFNSTFYLRRLHSLAGLLVLGGFLAEHIFTNAHALGGAQAFNDALALMELIPRPIFYGLEIGAVLLPFLFHAIYGIYIGLQAKNNSGDYSYAQNRKFALQRWTAWYLVPFLIWHVLYLRIYTKMICGTPISYELLYSYFQNPLVVGLYVLGMWAAIFHFCNGISTFCMTWGIAKGPRIQGLISTACMGLCALLCVVTVAFMGAYWMH